MAGFSGFSTSFEEFCFVAVAGGDDAQDVALVFGRITGVYKNMDGEIVFPYLGQIRGIFSVGSADASHFYEAVI